MPLRRSCAGALIGVDFEVLTPSPPANSNELAGIPPQASTPLQSFTRVPRRPTPSQPANRPENPCPLLPRFLSPSAFSQPCRATYLRRVPTHRLRCIPRVSHPLDALLPARPAGLVSSRSRSWGSLLEALFRARRRTLSPAPGPSWGSLPSPKSRAAPPGVRHVARSPTTRPGV